MGAPQLAEVHGDTCASRVRKGRRMLVEVDMRSPDSFDANKAVAAIGYLVQETGADLYSVMKMLYLADRAHLERYGRTVTRDAYVAMEKGPVPDRSYNLCKFVGHQREHYDAAPDARDHLRMNGNRIEVLGQVDLDELSRSDVQALAEAASIYNKGGWRAVFRDSHDAAWAAAWDAALASGRGMVEMDLETIAKALPNCEALLAYLVDPCPGDAVNMSPVSH